MLDPFIWPEAQQKDEESANTQGTEDWLYMRLTCQATEADTLLLKLIAPLTLNLWEQRLIRQRFFIRYYEGGHHLRVRFSGKSEDLFGPARTLVNEHIHAYFAGGQQRLSEPLDWGPEGMKDHSWQPLYAANTLRPVPSYEYQRYEPESERYGGSQGLQVSEQHFTFSSAAALRVLKQERAGNGSRRNAALLLLHASAESFQLDAGQKATSFEQFYLRRRALAWRTPPDVGNLEQEYARNRANLRLLIPYDLRAPAHRGQAVWLPLVEQWQDKVGETYRALQHLQEQGQLSTPLIVMLSAYIHMLCNRLGIYPREEAYLCYLLYRMYTERIALDQASF
jgi:thiopeptide-type bacteriocin biosynthesis protein